MLDAAFEALAKFDWGSDLAGLAPIDDAATAAHGKPEAGRALEDRLIAALKDDLTRDAQDFVCRKLALFGTAVSVPALETILVNKGNSHMSRFALERIPGEEAAKALRDALPKLSGNLKIGVISSLGTRRDSESIDALSGLMNDSDPAISRAAILALGAIGTAKSAEVLQKALPSQNANQSLAIDALLRCAESLLASNQRRDANAIYHRFNHDSQPRIVRLAATRGLLACASKQS